MLAGVYLPLDSCLTPSKPVGEVGKRHTDESQVVSAFVAKARLDQSPALESPSRKGTQPRSAGPLPNPPLTGDARKAPTKINQALTRPAEQFGGLTTS